MKTIQLSLFLMICFGAFVQHSAEAQEKKSKDDVYLTVEEMPEYPGGEEALRNDIASNVKYPEEAKKKGIQGKVYVSFVVDKNGKVNQAKIARGVDSALDKEALRVINSLKTWEPGKEKGKPVKVSFTVPINFVLDNAKKCEES
jgi:protein TonB